MRDPFRWLCRSLSVAIFLVLLAADCTNAQSWKSLGPGGGDARTLASDPAQPNVVYLGTTDGHIFGSDDAGRHWKLLGVIGTSQKAIVTAILIDPRHSQTLFASAWTPESEGESGGIFRSSDGGGTWQSSGLAGHAVRALVMAPSNPDVLVAGALDGVFRSRDAGKRWETITPAGDAELRNFDSLAIDPTAPDTIYAGTFHLPWKTTDGGKHWVAIYEGMIDDSDVLSLAINPSNPAQIFASACSGIYRSNNGGAHWKRVQGIPEASRRTLVIRFDPDNWNVLFVGTTTGLWKTTDTGEHWQRLSPADWVVNTLVVSAASEQGSISHLLIGTEQRGVLAGTGFSGEFEAVNGGFDHRRILSLTLDPANPARLGAVLANSSEPIVQTSDAGATWSPLGSGPESALVKRLFSTPDGWWASTASGGLLKLDPASGNWTRQGVLAGSAENGKESAAVRLSRNAAFQAAVNDLAFSEHEFFAATQEGLFRSPDAGKSWSLVPVSTLSLPVDSVRVSPDGLKIRLVSSHGMVFSDDAGRSWTWHDLPFGSGGAIRLERPDEGTLLATSPTGLFVSRDDGLTWAKAQQGLPSLPIDDVLAGPHFWAVSSAKGGLYLSRDRGTNWTRIEGPEGSAADYFPVLATASQPESIYAASASEGLYLLDLSRPSVLASQVGAER